VNANESDSWASLVSALETLRTSIAKSKAVNVNADRLRVATRDVVQAYFRQARPDLVQLGLTDDDLADLDRAMQRLLRLAGGSNAKSSYLTALKQARKASGAIELMRERSLSEARQTKPTSFSGLEKTILATLHTLAPTAALSYKQALLDLRDDGRVSFRGPAHELREATREVLDRLAPDADVEGQEGYKPEQGQTKPTQRQKMRYILKARGLGATARKGPEDTAALVDELTARITRASYQRSSLAAHAAASKGEVLQLKMYVDTVLAEILEVHRSG
jgi:hypothetical protein